MEYIVYPKKTRGGCVKKDSFCTAFFFPGQEKPCKEKIFFCNRWYHINAVIPFNMLEMLIAHQTPFTPNPKDVNKIAKGIRKMFAVMLIIAGGTVRPVP